MKKNIVQRSFYESNDVVAISQALLGKFLLTKIGSQVTGGMIIETEAYQGVTDKASHAYNNRRTARTETMYSQGGVAYIYLCYGLHHLFNIVTASEGVPHAVLIRAIKPCEGISIMCQRRNNTNPVKLSGGPGTLTQALGITKQLDGALLTRAPIWVEDRGVVIPKREIIATPRVGIEYAEEHRDLPWRFQLMKEI